jgi:hypothetical protein
MHFGSQPMISQVKALRSSLDGVISSPLQYVYTLYACIGAWEDPTRTWLCTPTDIDNSIN